MTTVMQVANFEFPVEIFNGRSRKMGAEASQKSVFIQMHRSFATDWFLKALKGPALSVFVFLSLCADENGESFPSIDTIVKYTGHSRSGVIEALQKLENLSIAGRRFVVKLKRKKGSDGGDTSNRYLILPDPIEAQTRILAGPEIVHESFYTRIKGQPTTNTTTVEDDFFTPDPTGFSQKTPPSLPERPGGVQNMDSNYKQTQPKPVLRDGLRSKPTEAPPPVVPVQKRPEPVQQPDTLVFNDNMKVSADHKAQQLGFMDALDVAQVPVEIERLEKTKAAPYRQTEECTRLWKMYTNTHGRNPIGGGNYRWLDGMISEFGYATVAAAITITGENGAGFAKSLRKTAARLHTDPVEMAQFDSEGKRKVTPTSNGNKVLFPETQEVIDLSKVDWAKEANPLAIRRRIQAFEESNALDEHAKKKFEAMLRRAEFLQGHKEKQLVKSST